MIPGNWDHQPVARIYTLSKNRKKKFSYNIDGFAINRIYTRNSTICISRFFGGVKVVEKLFFECENKIYDILLTITTTTMEQSILLTIITKFKGTMQHKNIFYYIYFVQFIY